MKCVILEMRDCGTVIERGRLKSALGKKGFLKIFDTRENQYNRIMKLAVLKDANDQVIRTLYSVSLLWLNGDKLGLTGFERVTKDDRLMDVAQSWTVRLDSTEAGRDNQEVMPKVENFRH